MLWTAVAYGLLVVLAIGFQTLLSMPMPNVFFMVGSIIPVMVAGGNTYRHLNARPNNGDAWTVCAVFALVHVVLIMALTALAVWSTPGAAQIFESLSLPAIAVFALLYGAFIWLVFRFVFYTGVRNEEKRLARLKAEEEKVFD
ncbi:MAG: ABZJ_00895 family protein [Pseudomonadota bacterium]